MERRCLGCLVRWSAFVGGGLTAAIFRWPGELWNTLGVLGAWTVPVVEACLLVGLAFVFAAGAVNGVIERDAARLRDELRR